MFTKAGLLIALLLVYLGYRWGTRKAQALSRPAQPAAPVAAPANPPATAPRKEVLTLKVLLGVAIVLLIIAILSSLQR